MPFHGVPMNDRTMCRKLRCSKGRAGTFAPGRHQLHRPLKTHLLPLLMSALAPMCAAAQAGLTFTPGIPLHQAGTPMAMPWAGGLNAPQFARIDLDQDGVPDLFALDRAGNMPLFFLNTGTAEQPHYTPTRVFDQVYPFPLLHDWAQLRDYNCDGKPDIFAYTNAGFAVYRNTSDAAGLSFVLTDDEVGSNYVPTQSPNLYISNVDLPGIVDVDGDGDLDVLTYSIWGNVLEYHKNLSMEQYGHCDSLVYEVRSRCWGDFQESMEGSAVTLNVPCSFNVPNPELPRPGGGLPHTDASDRAHSGSSILPLDLNGDGLMDLVQGDYQGAHLTALTNGGSAAHALMTAVDTLFPAYDMGVELVQFPAGFHLEVDGDGRRDLLVTPNSATDAEDKQGIWYYRNTGTDAAPVFQFQRNDYLQSDMLDLGSGARPVLFDHNSDGLMDLVVANELRFTPDGNYAGQLALLENIGTATHPAFALVTDDYADLASLGLEPGLHPAFGDVDGDGLMDMIVGDLLGNLHLFNNVSSGNTAQFQLAQLQLTTDAGSVFDAGANATPQLIDLDEDGLLDLVVGERNGNLNYLRNTGSATVSAWHVESEELGGVHVNEYWSNTGYSVPFLYRDSVGQLVLLSGSEAGGIHRYDGISGNILGLWNRTDSTWQGLRDGSRSALVLHDFTASGEPSVVVGNYRGGLSFWATGATTGEPSAIRDLRPAPFSLAPNPANDRVEVRWHAPLQEGLQLSLHDGLGRTVRAVPMGTVTMQLSLEGLATGPYIVRITDGRSQWAARLAVVR